MKYPDITLGRVEAVWNKLGGEEGVQHFLSDQSEVVMKTHLIDLDADPFIPEGWSVEEHRRGGQLEWDPSRIQLFLSPNQQDGKVIEGSRLREELADKAVLNANVLDYLLKYPLLIPEEWKGKLVFFWGTVYRHPGGSLYVRCLGWYGGRWDWGYRWLEYDWVSDFPAAVLASV